MTHRHEDFKVELKALGKTLLEQRRANLHSGQSLESAWNRGFNAAIEQAAGWLMGDRVLTSICISPENQLPPSTYENPEVKIPGSIGDAREQNELKLDDLSRRLLDVVGEFEDQICEVILDHPKINDALSQVAKVEALRAGRIHCTDEEVREIARRVFAQEAVSTALREQWSQLVREECEAFLYNHRHSARPHVMPEGEDEPNRSGARPFPELPVKTLREALHPEGFGMERREAKSEAIKDAKRVATEPGGRFTPFKAGRRDQGFNTTRTESSDN